MSTKTKTAYVCNDCGSEYRKWQGQCNDCKAWNTLTEVRLGSATRSSSISRTGFAAAVDGQVKTLSEITLDEIPRISTSVGELDLVLGGGLMTGRTIENKIITKPGIILLIIITLLSHQKFPKPLSN